jgi:hypothetical protein
MALFIKEYLDKGVIKMTYGPKPYLFAYAVPHEDGKLLIMSDDLVYQCDDTEHAFDVFKYQVETGVW